MPANDPEKQSHRNTHSRHQEGTSKRRKRSRRRMRRRQKYLSCCSDVSLIKIIITSSGGIIAMHYSWPTNPFKHNEITSGRLNVRTQTGATITSSAQTRSNVDQSIPGPPTPTRPWTPTPHHRLAAAMPIRSKVTSNRWRPCFRVQRSVQRHLWLNATLLTFKHPLRRYDKTTKNKKMDWERKRKCRDPPTPAMGRAVVEGLDVENIQVQIEKRTQKTVDWWWQLLGMYIF